MELKLSQHSAVDCCCKRGISEVESGLKKEWSESGKRAVDKLCLSFAVPTARACLLFFFLRHTTKPIARPPPENVWNFIFITFTIYIAYNENVSELFCRWRWESATPISVQIVFLCAVRRRASSFRTQLELSVECV